MMRTKPRDHLLCSQNWTVGKCGLMSGLRMQFVMLLSTNLLGTLLFLPLQYSEVYMLTYWVWVNGPRHIAVTLDYPNIHGSSNLPGYFDLYVLWTMIKFSWIEEILQSTLNDGVQVWVAERFWRIHVWLNALMQSLNVIMLGIFPAVVVGEGTFGKRVINLLRRCHNEYSSKLQICCCIGDFGNFHSSLVPVRIIELLFSSCYFAVMPPWWPVVSLWLMLIILESHG